MTVIILAVMLTVAVTLVILGQEYRSMDSNDGIPIGIVIGMLLAALIVSMAGKL